MQQDNQPVYDFIIIGGGIVGVSTAWQLQQANPHKRILLIEKEVALAQHQTGHNSGVIHAGVYYQPGSLKAQFCKEGLQATVAFCQQHDINYEQCGKLLVATNELELARMAQLRVRCEQNQIQAQQLSQQQLREREPNIQGLGALLIEETGIVDYPALTKKMAQLFVECGGEVLLQHKVTAMQEHANGITVNTLTSQANNKKIFECKFLISCSGLMADRCTRMLGIKTDFQIIPFRGEYYLLPPNHNQIVQHLIYPIPDPELPFLGVHLTRMIDGTVTVGPNAVQGWKREGYGKINLSARDMFDMLLFAGFWKVLFKHFKSGLKETFDSWFKAGYLKRVQKYCPSLTVQDLTPYPAGVRAQAVMKNGDLVHDFLFASSARSLHVCNAPSPAATSAMPIGAYICDKVAAQTQLLNLKD